MYRGLLIRSPLSRIEELATSNCSPRKVAYFVPELLEVWRHLRKLDSELRDYAHVGKGFDHEAQDALPKGTERFDSVEFPGAVEGFANWTDSVHPSTTQSYLVKPLR